MTPEQDLLAVPLAGGFVLVGPRGARLSATALRLAEAYAAQTGGRFSADARRLRMVYEVAATQPHASFDGFASETVESASLSDPSCSALTASSLLLLDPIGTTEAARLLRCSEQWVRACCRRGKFASARRRIGGWVLERSEVEALAAG